METQLFWQQRFTPSMCRGERMLGQKSAAATRTPFCRSTIRGSRALSRRWRLRSRSERTRPFKRAAISYVVRKSSDDTHFLGRPTGSISHRRLSDVLTDEMSTPSSNPVFTASIQHEIRERLNPTLGMFQDLQYSSKAEAVCEHSKPGGTAPLGLQKWQWKLTIPQPPQMIRRPAATSHEAFRGRYEEERGSEILKLLCLGGSDNDRGQEVIKRGILFTGRALGRAGTIPRSCGSGRRVSWRTIATAA